MLIKLKSYKQKNERPYYRIDLPPIWVDHQADLFSKTVSAWLDTEKPNELLLKAEEE